VSVPEPDELLGRHVGDGRTDYRVGDEPLRKLTEVFPNSGYGDWEEGRRDEFEKAMGESGA